MSESKSKLYIDASQYLQGFCRSMAHTGITNFNHDITFGLGEISMLMTDIDMYRFYHAHKIPIVCLDDSGRTLNPGLYINTILENQHRDFLFFMKTLRTNAHKLGLNFGKHSVHYAVNERHCQHLYSIFFDLPYDDFLYFVINNGAVINDMIDQYNFAAKDMIIGAMAVENRSILPSANDFLLSQNKQQIPIDSDRVFVIHKNSNLPIYLSSQRSQCLLHLLQGKSIKKIAFDMNLSFKTVEHYLEILRKELGCRSSKELIAHYCSQLL